jgi:hypothetical protein
MRLPTSHVPLFAVVQALCALLKGAPSMALLRLRKCGLQAAAQAQLVLGVRRTLFVLAEICAVGMTESHRVQ